ncbi:MAG: hypothetical protein ACHQJX_15555, partial [Candidatus Acidiferrales bacterium]
MRILALAPEQNTGIFYWAIVDIRTKPLESSEAGILNAVRERPVLVGSARCGVVLILDVAVEALVLSAEKPDLAGCGKIDWQHVFLSIFRLSRCRTV